MRRKELKSYCSGLLQSFVSRNADVDGYWAMGKLYAYAKRVDSLTIRLNLLDGSIEPSVSPSFWQFGVHDFTALATRYLTMLRSTMARRGAPDQWLQHAVITIEFESPHAVSTVVPIGPSKPYRCTLTLIDDLSKVHECYVDGLCWVHDPVRESQGMRA